MLFNCDTMVALPNTTKSRQTLFAKNSDRPREECQPLVYRDRQSHRGGEVTRCQFVELPQVTTTYRHVGSRPYWCWGYEHGFNEYQVVIGNEGLISKTPEFEEPKLVGMEIVRLGLERSRTAAESVEVMTTLITKYGQGRFKNDAGVRTYDNGYLVADPREAYVIETAGHEWVVKRVESVVGISNVHSVGTDWNRLSHLAEHRAIEQGWWQPESGRFDFAEAYCDFPASAPARGAQRRARSCALLNRYEGEIDPLTMMALLRDHSDGETPEEAFREEMPTTYSICIHYNKEREGNTAASLVADLCADGSRLPVYWCSFYSPCLGVFLPMFSEGRIPPILEIGDAQLSEESPWWLFRRLELKVREDQFNSQDVTTIRAIWARFQVELLDTAYRIAADARRLIDAGQDAEASQVLTGYMNRNVDRMLTTLRDMLARTAKSQPDRVQW